MNKTLLTPLRTFMRTDFGIFLAVAVVWQITMSVIGIALHPGHSLLGHMVQWDGAWYMSIAAQWYSPESNPASPAFYPLFPLVTSLLSFVSFGVIPLALSGLIINTLCLWLALVALWRITRHYLPGRRAGSAAIIGFMCFPSAFFMHAFYGEALFISIALWAYLFALNKKWWAMGLLLAALTASRLPSFLVALLCGVQFLQSYNWQYKKFFNKQLIWFALAPLGFILYGCYLWLVRGNFFAMFSAYHATNDWSYRVFDSNIIHTIGAQAHFALQQIATHHLTYQLFIDTLLPLASIAAIAIAAIYVAIYLPRARVPFITYSVASIILFSAQSTLISAHRYTLAYFPIFIALAHYATARKSVYRTIFISCICIASIGVQLFIYNKFLHVIFAG